MLFRDGIRYIKTIDNSQTLLSIVLFLILSLSLQSSFSLVHIFGLVGNQKHISNGNIVDAIGKPLRIGKGHHNSNEVINAKSIQNKGGNSGLSSAINIGGPAKVIILTFGDTEKSQFTTAKPILDQYGFKASFFITCGYVANDEKQTQRLNWGDILALQEDGQDIESKGMTHVDLNNLSSNAMEFEIGGSKQCLETHGINSPSIFAVVHGDAWNNPVVVNAISKYYGFADNGFASSMFLNCDGYDTSSKQNDCRTYNENGILTYANRYSIREESHNSWDQYYLHNDQMIFQRFVEEVNSGVSFNNKKGMVDAIPVVAYHIIDNSKDPSSTDVNLFAAEMKYLHDTGFKVIPMSDLGYDESTNHMYIKQ
jgi:Polysaccharide deacetylase